MTPTRQAERARIKHATEATARRAGMEALEPEELVALLASEEMTVHWAATDHLTRRGKAAIDALLAGLSSPDRRTRATSALLLDHVADNRCVGPLRQAMQHDPHEAVRRCAMHALVCDGCKECPLETDVIGALLEAARTDRSRAVRRRAIFYLSQQRTDRRVGPALEAILGTETDAIVRGRVMAVLAGLTGQPLE